MEVDLNLFYIWNTTSIYFVNKRGPQLILQMEDDLNIS